MSNRAIWASILTILVALSGCGSDKANGAPTCDDGGCVSPACEDGTQNGSETDVDCGGECGPCENGSSCTVPEDCSSAICADPNSTGPTCQVPRCDEALGSLLPVISNFHIEASDPSRVYFDSSMAIVGMTAASFTISNKTITSIELNGNSKAGHFFTVTAPFTFWDNNTIRLDASNIVCPFTMEYISNNIPEPQSTGTAMYVNGNVPVSGDGLSEVSAFKTLQEGLNAIGTSGTLFIKAGTPYVVTDHGELRTGGTASNPLKIIGYKDTPNDITSMYYNFTAGDVAPDLDATEMPLIEGNDLSKYGLWVAGVDYVIVKNIQAHGLARGITMYGGSNYVVENCIAKDIYGAGSVEGGGIIMGAVGVGDYTTPTNYRVKDSVALNAGGANIVVYGSNNLIEGSKSYCDNSYGTGSIFGTDYLIMIRGSNNIVRESTIEVMNGAINPASHGLSFRGASNDGEGDYGMPMAYNLAESMYVRSGSSEAVQFRNPDCKFNVVKDSEIVGFGNGNQSDGNGLVFQSGAQNNIYERVTVSDVYSAIEFTNGTESGTDPSDRHTSNNIVRNCIISNVHNVLYSVLANDFLSTFENNKIQHCTISGATNMMRGVESSLEYFSFSNNDFENCIINSVENANRDADKPQLAEMFQFDHTDTFNNGFVLPNSTNELTIDPTFIDSESFVPQNEALTAPRIPGISYDFYRAERRSETTVGAVLLTSETR